MSKQDKLIQKILDEKDVKTTTITYYFGDKKGNNLQQIYPKEFPSTVTYNSEGMPFWTDQTITANDIDTYAPDFSQY